MDKKKKIHLQADSVQFDEDLTADVEICAFEECIKIRQDNSDFCKEHLPKNEAQ